MHHSQLRQLLLDRAKLIAIATAVVALTRMFIADLVVVDGCSMQPGLQPGECLLVEKVTSRLGRLTEGDIVVLAIGSRNGLMVKRIVAMGGDEVTLRSGTVLVNGTPSRWEEQAIPDVGEDWGPRTVPPGALLVLGDNRPKSTDGTQFGPVAAGVVTGRVVGHLPRWAPTVGGVRKLLTRHAAPANAQRSEPHAAGPTALLGHTLSEMVEVQTACVDMGEKRVWICRGKAIREDTPEERVVFRPDGVWHYSPASRKLVITPPVHIGYETRLRLQVLLGLPWLQLVHDEKSERTYTVSDDSLDGRPTTRIDVLPGSGGYGATLWIAGTPPRVVRVKEAIFKPGTHQIVQRTLEISYEPQADPELFSVSVPGDVIVDDQRTQQHASTHSRMRHG